MVPRADLTDGCCKVLWFMLRKLLSLVDDAGPGWCGCCSWKLLLPLLLLLLLLLEDWEMAGRRKVGVCQWTSLMLEGGAGKRRGQKKWVHFINLHFKVVKPSTTMNTIPRKYCSFCQSVVCFLLQTHS